jgi:hypothetical protein
MVFLLIPKMVQQIAFFYDHVMYNWFHLEILLLLYVLTFDF